MPIVEIFKDKEIIPKPPKRIVVIGSGKKESVYRLGSELQAYLKDAGLEGIKVDAIGQLGAVARAMEGMTLSGKLEPKALMVIVGQQIDDYWGDYFQATLEVDRSGIVDAIRQRYGQDVFIGRYRRNPDGSFSFYPDGQPNKVTPMLPPDKKMLPR
jgi:hypothetical protein